jgi:hypothetical protein
MIRKLLGIVAVLAVFLGGLLFWGLSQLYAAPEIPKGYLINGVTYVPLRFVSENLGATVSWDSGSNIAKITDPRTKKTITIRAVEMKRTTSVSSTPPSPKASSPKIIGEWVSITNPLNYFNITAIDDRTYRLHYCASSYPREGYIGTGSVAEGVVHFNQSGWDSSLSLNNEGDLVLTNPGGRSIYRRK